MGTRALIGQIGADGNAHLHYIHRNGSLRWMLPTLAAISRNVGGLPQLRGALLGHRYAWDDLDGTQVDYATLAILPEWENAEPGSVQKSAWYWANGADRENAVAVSGVGVRRRKTDRRLTIAEIDRDEERLMVRADMIGWSYLLDDDRIEAYRSIDGADEGHVLVHTINLADLARPWTDAEVDEVMESIQERARQFYGDVRF